MLKFWTDKDIENFMLESNKIEGEYELNPNDMTVAEEACYGIKDLDHLKDMHGRLTKHLNVGWSGRWRIVNVSVGSYSPPIWKAVPELMLQFFSNYHSMDSWIAHNEFQKIHPFQDFNGRAGRLIWLSKAVKEGRYRFRLPFLQTYYYQTLNHYRYSQGKANEKR